jgi:hypothetical protein
MVATDKEKKVLGPLFSALVAYLGKQPEEQALFTQRLIDSGAVVLRQHEAR